MFDLLSAYRMLNVSLSLSSVVAALWVLLAQVVVGNRLGPITLTMLDYVTNASIAVLVLYIAHLPFYKAIQRSALRSYMSAEISYGLIASALIIVVLTTIRITQNG